MKLLVLYQAREAEMDQPGYYQGFRQLVSEGALEEHCALPLVGVAEKSGWGGLWQQSYDLAKDRGVDAVFLQFLHSRMPDPTRALERIKSLPGKPVVFASSGDPFGKWTNRVNPAFRVASRLSDVTFLTGTGYLAEQLAGWGSKNVVLMPHGCCQVRFSTAMDHAHYNPEFDVVFIGNRMTSPNPFGHFYRVGKRRDRFVHAITKRYGKRFGLFGSGWDGNPSWQGQIPYVDQHAAMRRSRVVLGGLPNGYYDYYTSDREFNSLASGVPFVGYAERGLNRLFQDGAEWWLAGSVEGMIKRADSLLEQSQSTRLNAAAKTRARVLAAHTQYHRCRDMIAIVESVRRAHRDGQRAALPKLSFLLDDPTTPAPPAILAWQG